MANGSAGACWYLPIVFIQKPPHYNQGILLCLAYSNIPCYNDDSEFLRNGRYKTRTYDVSTQQQKRGEARCNCLGNCTLYVVRIQYSVSREQLYLTLGGRQ
jgi:hypothetical protein